LNLVDEQACEQKIVILSFVHLDKNVVNDIIKIISVFALFPLLINFEDFIDLSFLLQIQKLIITLLAVSFKVKKLVEKAVGPAGTFDCWVDLRPDNFRRQTSYFFDFGQFPDKFLKNIKCDLFPIFFDFLIVELDFSGSYDFLFPLNFFWILQDDLFGGLLQMLIFLNTKERIFDDCINTFNVFSDSQKAGKRFVLEKVAEFCSFEGFVDLIQSIHKLFFEIFVCDHFGFIEIIVFMISCDSFFEFVIFFVDLRNEDRGSGQEYVFADFQVVVHLLEEKSQQGTSGFSSATSSDYYKVSSRLKYVILRFAERVVEKGILGQLFVNVSDTVVVCVILFNFNVDVQIFDFIDFSQFEVFQ
jgi:hypothetical protein